MLLFPWLRCWHGSGLETEGVISVAPNGSFQQIADRQFQFHPLADAEIGRDDRFCSPAARYGIHIASDTDILSFSSSQTKRTFLPSKSCMAKLSSMLR